MKTVKRPAENGMKVIAGGLCLGLLGCPIQGTGSSDPPPEPTPVAVSSAVECSAPTLPPSTCDQICPPTHQIGRCGPDDEQLTTVEDPDGGERRSAWIPTRLGIGDYCSYVLENGDPSLVGPDWQRDCPLGPAGDELDGALASMAENFLDGAAGVAGSGLNNPYPQWAGESPEVMVAVVDTAAEPVPEEAVVELEGEAGRHGRTMAAIVRRIACGPTSRSSCPIVVRSFLGLPLLRDGKEGPKGGIFGRQSHLAQGLKAAIDEWEELVDEAPARANPAPKLIINLSVGWEPGCGARNGGNEAELVRNQLQRVQGNSNVIVLAASGNRALGSAAVGFMGPATWESEALLYGVTPLDDRSENLVTFRPQSNAQLAARGYMAVVRDTRLGDNDPDEGGVYGPVSGSSVSTAVVAAIAARTWVGYDGTADQLMGHLWQNGEPRDTPVLADSHWSAPPNSERLNETTQHEVSLCRSLGGPNPGSCSPEHDAQVEAATAFWSVASGLSIDSVSVTTTGEGSCADQCMDTDCARTVTLTATGGTTPSPTPKEGFVVPQPSVPPCPTCYVKVNASPSTAHLLLDSAYSGYSLYSTTIQLWNASNGTESHVYTGLSLSSSTWTTLTDADFADVANLPTTKGYITMVFLDNGTPFTVGNDLIIVE